MQMITSSNGFALFSYASRIGPQVLTYYEEYFQIPFPLPKQVASV